MRTLVFAHCRFHIHSAGCCLVQIWPKRENAWILQPSRLKNKVTNVLLCLCRIWAQMLPSVLRALLVMACQFCSHLFNIMLYVTLAKINQILWDTLGLYYVILVLHTMQGLLQSCHGNKSPSLTQTQCFEVCSGICFGPFCVSSFDITKREKNSRSKKERINNYIIQMRQNGNSSSFRPSIKQPHFVWWSLAWLQTKLLAHKCAFNLACELVPFGQLARRRCHWGPRPTWRTGRRRATVQVLMSARPWGESVAVRLPPSPFSRMSEWTGRVHEAAALQTPGGRAHSQPARICSCSLAKRGNFTCSLTAGSSRLAYYCYYYF